MNDGERHLWEYQHEMAGGFYTALFTAIQKADRENMNKMCQAFPEEVEAFLKFRGQKGYWESLEERYKLYGDPKLDTEEAIRVLSRNDATEKKRSRYLDL